MKMLSKNKQKTTNITRMATYKVGTEVEEEKKYTQHTEKDQATPSAH